MTEEEIQFFRKLTKGMDIYTPNEVEIWLRSYPEFTIGEKCAVIKRSPGVVERLIRTCGLCRVAMVDVGDKWLIASKTKNKKVWKTQKIEHRPIDDKWVKEQYENGKSINWICKTCKCSHTKVENILKKHNIKRKTHGQIVRTKNKYCSKEWVEEHYIKLGYHMDRCAQIAGVSRCTIRYWMIKFNIEPRSVYEIGVKE